MPHRVLLVEDDVRTRTRLARAIEASDGLSLQAQVGTCAEARLQLARAAPDVLLTDIGLPDGSGLDLIRETRETHPQARSMVITVFGDERHVVEAVRAGAAGYLLKDASQRELGRSILDLLAGGSPISPAVARYLLKLVPPVAAASPPSTARGEGADGGMVEPLSARELDVLQLVADGCSYAEIGQRLFISINTVGTHIKHIYDKLSVNSRAKAVREAGQRGLLTRSWS